MCLFNVKEEPDYSVPARVTNFRRDRTYSSDRPRSARYSSTRIIEERRPSGYTLPPPGPPAPLPPPARNAHFSSTDIEVKQSQSRRSFSRPPSVHQSTTAVETKRTSRAPSVRSRTRTHYVEVDHDTSSSSSSSSSSDDLRSRTTHKTSNTRKSGTTHKSSKTRTTAPASEYSIHEKEIRRERTYARPRDGYDNTGRRMSRGGEYYR